MTACVISIQFLGNHSWFTVNICSLFTKSLLMMSLSAHSLDVGPRCGTTIRGAPPGDTPAGGWEPCLQASVAMLTGDNQSQIDRDVGKRSVGWNTPGYCALPDARGCTSTAAPGRKLLQQAGSRWRKFSRGTAWSAAGSSAQFGAGWRRAANRGKASAFAAFCGQVGPGESQQAPQTVNFHQFKNNQ
jgi:hypothetical protein